VDGIESTVRRLFVAVRPPPSITEELAALVAELEAEVGGAVRWSPPDGYHVTLRYIGEAPVEPVRDALDEVLPTEQTTIELGPGLIELGSAIVAPAAGADGMAAVVRAAVGDFGPPQVERPFLGHLTIGRWRRGQGAGELIGRAVGGRFTTGTVELMASARPAGESDPAPGQGAASESRYETIGAWSAPGQRA